MTKKRFLLGDPVPDFYCPSTNNPNFCFNAAAGRYIVLFFYGSASIEKNAKALAFFSNDMRHYFDDSKMSFFGISVDQADRDLVRVNPMPGIRYFWDFDHSVSRLYGAIDSNSVVGDADSVYRVFTLVLDPNLRVIANVLLNDLEQHNQTLSNFLASIPAVDNYACVPITAPVLIIPRVFELSLCQALISLYQTYGGNESGSMIERDGVTIGKIDYGFKRRLDCNIDDAALRAEIRARIKQRIVPEVFKAFQFKVTHIERYIVACYDGEHQGFFRPHRDNNTKGTAHRRFACTINLNAGEYEGGDLRFPEFGTRTYRAPTGGAVVFSCSLLHEVLPVTKGVRYATLPFFYDAEAAKIREENQQFLTSEVINLN